MNTSNEILDTIELSHLLCKIDAQIKNIESGDAHTQIGNNKIVVSVVNKSCLQIINLLSSSYLNIQKVPMVKPLADLYNEAKINLQKNCNDSLISDMDKLSNKLFV